MARKSNIALRADMNDVYRLRRIRRHYGLPNDSEAVRIALKLVEKMISRREAKERRNGQS